MNSSDYNRLAVMVLGPLHPEHPQAAAPSVEALDASLNAAKAVMPILNTEASDYVDRLVYVCECAKEALEATHTRFTQEAAQVITEANGPS